MIQLFEAWKRGCGMPADWIDSHAHLTMAPDDEVGPILERARAAGVRGVVVPATNPEDLGRTLELARTYPESVAAAIGIHPHDASQLDGAAKRLLERRLGEPGVVAVGEIGLDYHYMNSPREDQIAAFEWQLELAAEAGRPVIIHNRESWDDLFESLKRGPVRGVCHSFTEGPDVVREVVALGLFVGVSGMVTFKRADNIREMTAAIPPDRLLVETDSPFLAPVPHRGRTNEPSYVPLVGQAVADVLGVSGAEAAQITTANVERLFAVTFGSARQ